MSAFQPMIAEIQTKYKDKPEKQQAELMKLRGTDPCQRKTDPDSGVG